ncbi:MAG: 16S rRNA (adenine1518-N6/adenine1519-N6)-dimethyltransferase [Candidatus Paceibacteria bacterium]|jgi:16S rRNA (adenine1518-N6/adenine1519-N6)-dimethyltransferase
MTEKFEHKKSLGQHFLNSDFVPKKMCDAADLQTGEIVLEIGPGTGILTKEILKRGANVIAIEADLRAIELLKETFVDELTSGQLVVHHHDARKLDMAMFGLVDQQFKVVANIPYYISGLLFRQCLEADIQPNTLVFLVQKEVAQRIAQGTKESILSLSVKVFGEPKYIDTIKRGHFTPPPAVDSAIVAIYNINRSRLNGITDEVFFDVLHAGFGQKRKQLAGNLSKLFQKETVSDSLVELGLTPQSRAEDLSITHFINLITLLQGK